MLIVLLSTGVITQSRTPIATNRATDHGAGAVATPHVPELPVALLTSAPIAAPARSGTVSFDSAALGRVMPYLIFLPPGYDSEPERRYPVLYMLHGMGGTYTEWYGYGIFPRAEALITAGDVEPFIIVLPQGDTSYWVDHANDGPRWGDYITADLLREIDGRYRTIATPTARAIGGLSMGAHGALQLALTRPGLFGVIGAHSPTLRGHGDAPPYFGDEAYFRAHDPVHLIQERPEIARSWRLYLDDGLDDGWLPVVSDFHNMLTSLAIAHEWRQYPGGHDGRYWAANLDRYLRFYGGALAAGVAQLRPPPTLASEPPDQPEP